LIDGGRAVMFRPDDCWGASRPCRSCTKTASLP